MCIIGIRMLVDQINFSQLEASQLCSGGAVLVAD